jgi:hypothetical protein
MAAELQRSDDDVTKISAHLARLDSVPLPVRAAVSILGPLVKDLPQTETFLLSTDAVRAWRALRAADPELFMVYRETVKQKCGRGVVSLVDNAAFQDQAEAGALAGWGAERAWEAYTPPRYVVKGMLDEAAVTIMFGAPASYKSFLALDLAMCAATGFEWHGFKTRRGGVVYLSGEGYGGLPRRIRAWLLDHGVSEESERPAIYVTSEAPDLLGAGGRVASTIGRAQEGMGCDVRLVVVDTLSACFGRGDENATGDVNHALRVVREAAPMAAVLVVHHTGHGEALRERGSSAIGGTVDKRFSVAYDSDSRTIEVCNPKMKDGPTLPAQAFAWRQIGTGWQDEDGEEITSVVLDRIAADAAGDERTAPLGTNQQTALKVLRRLYAARRRNVEERGDDPESAAVLLTGWKDACAKAGIDPRKRWPEVLEGLTVKKKLVVLEGPLVRLNDGAEASE